jgi:hypothetical protein
MFKKKRFIFLSSIVFLNQLYATNNFDIQKNIQNQKEQIIQKANMNSKYIIPYKNFKELLKEHKFKKNKLILLVVGTPECPWTRKEFVDLLGYDPLWKYIKHNYYIVFANLKTDNLPDTMLISTMPTMFVLSPLTGSIIVDKPVVGYVNKNQLLDYLKKVHKGWEMYLQRVINKEKGNKNENK